MWRVCEQRWGVVCARLCPPARRVLYFNSACNNACDTPAAVHGLDASAEAMSHAQGWIETDFPGIHVRTGCLWAFALQLWLVARGWADCLHDA